MLRTNLATRPFYNERAVYLGLGLIAVVGLAVLGLEIVELMDLSRRNGDLVARAETAEAETGRLSAQTAQLQQTVNPEALEQVAAPAREANTLIDQRVFSWTDFFNRIETTLPPDVMLTRVQPDISPELIEVTMEVLGRRFDDISGFIDAMEASGDFAEVLNRQADLTEDGMYRATLRGRYLQTLLPAPDEADATEGDESERADDPALDESVTPGEDDGSTDDDPVEDEPAEEVPVADDTMEDDPAEADGPADAPHGGIER